MNKMKSIFLSVLAIAIGSLGLVGFINYYPYIMARSVTGEVVSIERLEAPMAIMNSGERPPNEIFSFAVGIEDKNTGEIITASSEDRRWAAVQKGNCATAKFFPYPPWRLDKSGTYFNARLITLMKSCDGMPR